MKDWITLAVSSAVALLAAYYSARWAVSGVFREKWWERKEKAYGDIINALHDIIRYLEIEADAYRRHEESEHPKRKQFADSYSEAYWQVKRATDIGAFVISKRAADALLTLQSRPKLDFGDGPPWELYDEEADHYRTALAELKVAAVADLKV